MLNFQLPSLSYFRQIKLLLLKNSVQTKRVENRRLCRKNAKRAPVTRRVSALYLATLFKTQIDGNLTRAKTQRSSISEDDEQRLP